MDDGTATVPALKTEDAIPVAPDNADFTPVVADAPPPLREDQIQNAMAFLNHPKVHCNCGSDYSRWNAFGLRAGQP